MLKIAVAFSCLLVAIKAQQTHFHLVPLDAGAPHHPHPQPAEQRIRPVTHNVDESPKPFSFSYEVVGEDGGNKARHEDADGTGRVSGSYSIRDPDGRNRIVQYIADALGFRATIQTNEEGTESQNPADVVIQSSAPTAYELVQRYAAQYGHGHGGVIRSRR